MTGEYKGFGTGATPGPFATGDVGPEVPTTLRVTETMADQPLTAPTDEELTVWLHEAQEREADRHEREYGILMQVIRLVAEVRRLRETVKAIEWDANGRCSMCCNDMVKGHDIACDFRP
jgi:hypothetical protein